MVQVDEKGEVLFEAKPTGNLDQEEELKDVAINPSGDVLAIGIQYDKKSSRNWLLGIGHQTLTINRTVENPELAAVEALVASEDDHFVLLGNTTGKNRNNPNDAWVLKVNKEGEEVWEGPQFFGDREFQEGLDITNTPMDGGFVIVGANNSGSEGMADMWLLKMDENGEFLWEKTYGGHATDVANAVIELSEGGYALLGSTQSHMPKADHSTLQLIITDATGNRLDSDTYYIVDGEGDEVGHSILELYTGDKVVIAGSSKDRETSVYPAAYVGAVSYKYRPVTRESRDDGTYSSQQISLTLSESVFVDADRDNLLESGERGYFVVEVANESGKTLYDVSGAISANDNIPVRYWDNIKLGVMRSGQTKRLLVPVKAEESLVEEGVQLNVDISSENTYAASSVLSLGAVSDTDPAKLLVEDFSFIPGENPQPGDITRLQVELVNVGALPSEPVSTNFTLPVGVEAYGPASVDIPSIRPRSTHKVAFSFTYTADYKGRDIPVTLQTLDRKLMKTFYLTLGSQPVTAVVNTGGNTAAATGAEVYWVNPKPNARTVDVNSREVNLTAMTLSTKQMSKGQVQIFINGQKYQGQKMDEAKLGPSENSANEKIQQFYENRIRLREGNNKVKIVCYDENGQVIQGESKTMIFNYIPKDKPNLYVLSIGVEHEDLEYTVKDAQDFSNMYWRLRDDKGRGFKRVKVFPLLKKEETTAFNIKKSFIDLEKMGIKDNDLVVVFISSHGKINDKGEFLLIPSDYDSQYEEISSVNFKEDVLKKLRVLDGNKLVFIDACHSGGAGGKSFSDKAASKVMNDLVHATSGMEIFASCGDDEFSYEDARWGNGAFTKAIIEAFENRKVDVNGKTMRADIFADDPATGQKINGSDGVITIEELKLFVQSRVPYLVKSVKQKKQYPINKSTELLPENMGIYMVN